MNDILKQIDQLVADKTFSLDALEGVKNIRDALIKAETKIEELGRELDFKTKSINDLTKQLENLTSDRDILRGEVAAMKATVEAGREAIHVASKHEAVANAWKEAMQTVFKPNTVREVVNKSVPIAQSQAGGGSYVSHWNDTTNVVREEG